MELAQGKEAKEAKDVIASAVWLGVRLFLCALDPGLVGGHDCWTHLLSKILTPWFLHELIRYVLLRLVSVFVSRPGIGTMTTIQQAQS